MLAYVVRRLVFLVVSLGVAAVVTFVLLRLLPGDPANALTTVGASPEQIAAARRAIGSDQPLPQQFVTWLGDMARFDMGHSFISGLPVGSQLQQRLSITLPLTLIAFALAILIAGPVGFAAAKFSRSPLGLAVSALAQFGIAVPVFWVGILLVWWFSLGLRILPPSGIPTAGWSDPLEMLRFLTLPVVTIAVVMSASLTRYVRSACIDVMGSGYLTNFRALGASFGSAFWHHGMKSVAVPLTSVLGIELATTFLGAVVVENVFALPGLGSLIVTGIAQHDYPTIQGVLLMTTLLVLIVGFVADFTQKLLDPRLREAHA